MPVTAHSCHLWFRGSDCSISQVLPTCVGLSTLYLLYSYPTLVSYTNICATTLIVNFSISLDTNGELHPLCVSLYDFQKGVLPKVTPHCNSKSNKPFHQTWSSAMERIKKEAQTHGLCASSASGG